MNSIAIVKIFQVIPGDRYRLVKTTLERQVIKRYLRCKFCAAVLRIYITVCTCIFSIIDEYRKELADDAEDLETPVGGIPPVADLPAKELSKLHLE